MNHPMTNDQKAELLHSWFANRELPERFQYGDYYKAGNPARYVQTACETMHHAEKGSNAFRAAYYRLWRLKKHLELDNLK